MPVPLPSDSSLVVRQPSDTLAAQQQQERAGHTPSLLRVGSVRIPDVLRRLQRAGEPESAEATPQQCSWTLPASRVCPTPLLWAGIEADLVDGGLVTRGAGVMVLRPHKPEGDSSSDSGNTDAAAQAAPGFGFVLEGPMCDEYFAVRAALYGMYAAV